MPAATSNTPPSRLGLLWAGAGGLSLAAVAVAALTIRLNPQLETGPRLRLFLVFGFAGLVVGAILGGLALTVAVLARRIGGRRADWVARGLAGVLALGPPVYVLALPDTGLMTSFLTDVLFGPRPVALLLAVVVFLTLTGAGVFLVRLPWHRRLGRGLWVAGFLLAVAIGLAAPRLQTAAPGEGGAETATLRETPGELPTPVVLLVVDGLDFQVLDPLLAAGELPTFARLREEGAWGPLETLEPTLSAVIWTTLATGKDATAHGIHHFTYFRVPGVGAPIRQFPLHTGLNFELFPLFEKIPGSPLQRSPYTSRLRRTEALWNLVGRRYPVGVYRWLITWPAEPVNGFVVANGFDRIQLPQDDRGGDGARWPPDLEMPRVRGPRRLDDEALRRYVGPGSLDRSLRRVRYVERSALDPSLGQILGLWRRYEPRFLAAAFFSVDIFHHHFHAHVDGRPGEPAGVRWANAVDERYRLLDERLGELLDALGEVQLVLVSDHGFDFEHGHHTWKPPGVFFGHGSAFPVGRRVEGLSVYDVAPLVLRLLDLPVPLDMPGTARGVYAAALAEGWRAAHPEVRIPTYGQAPADVELTAPTEDDAEIRERLKSLGYL